MQHSAANVQPWSTHTALPGFDTAKLARDASQNLHGATQSSESDSEGAFANDFGSTSMFTSMPVHNFSTAQICKRSFVFFVIVFFECTLLKNAYIMLNTYPIFELTLVVGSAGLLGPPFHRSVGLKAIE